jgi:hypothetical protein
LQIFRNPGIAGIGATIFLIMRISSSHWIIKNSRSCLIGYRHCTNTIKWGETYCARNHREAVHQAANLRLNSMSRVNFNLLLKSGKAKSGSSPCLDLSIRAQKVL